MTTTLRSSQCLDDETIAAFVDGGLDRDARDRVEQHAASCTDCYAILVTVAGALPMLPHALKSTRSTVVGRRHLWLWIGATAAAAAVVSALWLGYRRPPSARPELAALVSAVGRERPVESRLTGGFAWAPFDAGVRGDSTVRPPPDVRIAAARIEQALAGQRSAVNVAAFGTSLLVLGDVNGAVTALEEATRLDRGRAAYWSDLGAAYLASAGRSGGDVNLPRALEAVETALSIAPTLAEARFNRAVILERFGLRERAIDAWEAYLAIDASSPWRAEANQRLQELRARSLPPQGDRDLQPARRRLYRELLSDWVDAVQRGASGRDSIAAMRVVVSEIDEQAVDPMAHGVVAALAEAETATQARRRAVADAYATFLRSQAALDAEAFDVALASSSAARVRLGALGSPLALSARFNEAVVAYRRGEALHARHLLAGIREEVRARAYAPLLGRVDWMLGLIEALQGRRGRAAQYYESALAAFKAASENANVASVEGLAAANYDNIGDPIRGWTFRLDALRGNRHPGVLLSASLSALRLGWPRAALVLSDFALDTARATNSPANVADALRIEAAIASELGISSTARRFIDEAKAFVAGRSEPAWERVNAEIALAEARASTTTAAAGIGAAGTAIAYFTKTGARGRLPELYEIRARLYAQLGDRARAKADVLAGLDSLEHQRRDIPPGVDQVMFEAVERALVCPVSQRC